VVSRCRRAGGLTPWRVPGTAYRRGRLGGQRECDNTSSWRGRHDRAKAVAKALTAGYHIRDRQCRHGIAQNRRSTRNPPYNAATDFCRWRVAVMTLVLIATHDCRQHARVHRYAKGQPGEDEFVRTAPDRGTPGRVCSNGRSVVDVTAHPLSQREPRRFGHHQDDFAAASTTCATTLPLALARLKPAIRDQRSLARLARATPAGAIANHLC